MIRLRLALGTVGVALGLFGVFRLVTQVPLHNVLVLALWLIGALVIHDGILSPVVLAVGTALRRVPGRARAYLEGALLAGALITVIAVPLIHRQGLGPAQKALLRQDYRTNLVILLGIVAAAALLLYATRVIREHRRPSIRNDRPPADHDSSGV